MIGLHMGIGSRRRRTHAPGPPPARPGGEPLSLSEVPAGAWCRIDALDGPVEPCRRLLDLGLTPGEEVTVVQVVPLGGPVIVAVRGARLALRREEAAWIRVR